MSEIANVATTSLENEITKLNLETTQMRILAANPIISAYS